ncbi:PREDICTED: uncharacterized protein LOC106787239 [Polistes canadensis]|uniref:uncharacterized protein LOC106787239 n=1 Tax=Polistes canadensis TaxID=91411 RepID=UPI000718E066|nr:PREDICTED: uncharacterized protein LOC106787239 [Polistes canadensis]
MYEEERALWQSSFNMWFPVIRILCLTLNLLLTCSSKSSNSEIAETLHRPIRSLSFPEASSMGIFLAIAVPLEDPQKSISLSYFFEASYTLPSNLSYFEPWSAKASEVERKRRKIRKRSIDRTTIYRVLESKFERFLPSFSFFFFHFSFFFFLSRRFSSGYLGRECLLKTICENSEHPLHHNGLIGDIFHVIFTPTTSRHEKLPGDIVEAELVGRNGSCSKYQPQCPVGLFDLIGVLV